MSFWSSLLAWGNVPFTVVLGVAVVFALLQASGLLGLLAGAPDADGDGGADADVDGVADVDGDADGDDVASAHAFLASLGVGKVPLFVVGETFAVTFAVAGLAVNTASLVRTGAVPANALAWAVPIALVVAYATTRGASSLLARLFAGATEATARAELVGRAGVVISSRVDADFGEIRLQDRSGHVVRVVCRTRAGAIPEGREVVVVDEDETDGRLLVAPLD